MSSPIESKWIGQSKKYANAQSCDGKTRQFRSVPAATAIFQTHQYLLFSLIYSF